MKPTLVILAAGIGSRYGGLKQVQPVGPGGATIMDYSVYDAIRAGFGKAVFVIRPEMESTFAETLGRRFARHIAVSCAVQRLDLLPKAFEVPPGRAKPWGTAHAVLTCRQMVREPFAVINADDFYGAGAFVALAEFLRAPQPGTRPTYAMVGYRLRDTLSDRGSVSRAICQVSPDGWLQSITEITGIEKHGEGARFVDQAGIEHTLNGDETVSMNMWAFLPTFFAQLAEGFDHFLRESDGLESREFYLPSAIQHLIATGQAAVKVVPTSESWCGMTHREDQPRVEQMIAGLVSRGVYPARLWP